MTTQAQPQPAKMTEQQASLVLRAHSLELTQNIANGTIYPASNPVQQTPWQNVGVVKRFIIDITATIKNNDAANAATLTDNGLANLLTNVVLTDYANNQRINTTGLHLSILSQIKRFRPYGATGDYNVANGNNVSGMFNVNPAAWPVFQAPATIPANGSVTVRGIFEVPLAYSDDNLKGAVYAGIINTNAYLTFTANQNPISPAGSDSTFAIYAGSSGGTITSMSYIVYQVYLDQLPLDLSTRRPILPFEDLSTVYELKNSSMTGITAGQDFSIPFQVFRSFMSVAAVYANDGATRAYGTDVNYWSLKTANTLQLFQYNANYAAFKTRQLLGNDLPAGTYYFDFRRRPINIGQYGNQSLFLNASVAAAGAKLQTMWEAFVKQSLINQSGTLAAS